MSPEEIKVKKGTKVEPEEAKTMDRTKMGVGRPAPPQSDVEGQWHGEYVMCPWCGAVNYCWVSDVVYLWFSCWNCGGGFRA